MTGALKFLPVAMLALVACKKTEDVPSYLEVPVFGMTTDPSQGAPSTKITDAWVTVNGTFVGVWELPARIPVLGAGQAEVEVAPAIKRNGLFDDRLRYPFYTTWSGTADLVVGGTTTVAPLTRYREGLNFWLEPFDAAGTLLSAASTSDTLYIFRPETDPQLVRDGSPVGGIELTASNSLVRLETDQDFGPASGPVFLEMDYSTDVELEVGVKYVEGSFAGSEPYVTLVPTTLNGRAPVWNKAYLDLSSLFNTGSLTARDLYFEAQLGIGQSTGTVLLDNLKIVRFQ